MVRRLKKKGRKTERESDIAQKSGGLKFTSPKKLVVLHSNGCRLYGAVARCSALGSVSIEQPVCVSVAAPETAVAAVVEVLLQKYKRIPKVAVLLTPSVISDFVDLPVNPRKKKAAAQMDELVRWEMEEQFAAQGELWSLGTLLEGQGFISAADRAAVEGHGSLDTEEAEILEVDDIVQENAEEEDELVELAPAGGFAELVTPEQMEQTLNLQEMLSGMDDELVTGSVSLGSAGEEGQFLWYGVGMGDGLRNRWAKACRDAGMVLKAIYPTLGAGLPVVLDRKTEQWVYVDIQELQYAIYTGNGNKPATMTVKSRDREVTTATLADEIIANLQGETRICFLCAPAELLPRLAAAIEEPMEIRGGITVACGGEKGLEALEDKICPWSVRQGMEGVVTAFWKLADAELLVGMDTKEKQAAWWKDFDILGWTFLGLFFVSALVGYFLLDAAARNYNRELLQKDIEFEKVKKMKADMRETAGKVRALQDELKKEKENLALQEHNRTILNGVIRKRQKLVPDVLKAISRATDENIMIDILEENPNRKGLYIRAWATKESLGQGFANRLNEELQPLGYRVDGAQTAKGGGAYGLGGSVLRIGISLKPSVKAGKQKRAK